MKRFLLIFILINLILPDIFSQDRKHTVYIDNFAVFNGVYSGGAGLGIGYDYSINRFFSAGGYISYLTDFKKNFTYNFIANGKYFPVRTAIGAPYVDLGLGYRRRKSEEDDIHSLTGLGSIGFRFIFGNGLVLDPGFGVRYNIIPLAGSENFNLGFSIKTIAGWTF